MAQNFIEVPVIKLIINQALKRPKFAVITDKPARIKGGPLKLHLDNIVMAMQARTGVVGIKSGQLVACGKGELFGDGKHRISFGRCGAW
mgnify:FL=1